MRNPSIAEYKTYHSMAHLLPAIAYGDAAGLPYESAPPDFCRINGVAPVLPPAPNSLQGLHELRSDFLGNYPAGTYSDDTSLSLATMRAITESGFTMGAIARWHVRSYLHTTGEIADDWDLIPPIVHPRRNGWGGSTVDSMLKLQEGVSFTDSGKVDGAGNGVLMKMAPVVMYQIAKHLPPGLSEYQVSRFTEMTHLAAEATIASLVHRKYLHQAHTLSSSPVELLESSYYHAQQLERRFGTQPVLSNMLRPLRNKAKNDNLEREDILEVTPLQGFYAPETLAMVYGSFVLESAYPACVYRAVELGGDADSVGSIIAATSVIQNPYQGQPADIGKVYALNRLRNISLEFANESLRAHFSVEATSE